jgi:hypothetical protein
MSESWTGFRQAECLARLLCALGAILVALGLCGCTTSRSALRWAGISTGPEYQPRNIFRPMSQLPTYVQRVAVLPISGEANNAQANVGRVELQSVLQAELGKAQRFELAAVSNEQMRQLTGRETWRPDEKLPHNLIDQLRDQFGCEAILLSHLQSYHAYRPVKVGWNFKLVDLQARQIVWAADEVFDASDASVSRAAQHYYRDHSEGVSGDDAGVLYSPRRFGQYTLSALFATLPAR